MKSIIQVLPALNQGGVERGTIEIATALKKAGIPNYVISSGGKMVPELTKIGVEHITLPVATKNPIKLWLNSKKMARIFKEKNAGLIHVRSRAPAWSVKWASQKINVPYIATYHGCYGIKPALKKIYNRVMIQGEKVIAVSDFIKKHLMDEYQVPENKIVVIPRGADTKLFDPERVGQDKIQAFLTQYDIPVDKPIISLVGRLSRIKGQSVMLDAFQYMKHSEVTLLLVGGNPKGEYEKELQTELAKLPEDTTVKIFAVPGKEMPVVYAASDIFVQPTLVPESFGRSIAEAGAMKRVVVASAHGGACELIENGVTGFLVPTGDAKALAEMVDKVLDMPQKERDQIGERACANIRENFTIQKMCEKTLALYQKYLVE
ncbi:MAG: glycosyltransferase family 4 protein [Alphaproteobacteria bacterium]|nr:glycosyltransferase family 4 protein [Alphaproteobacteria bacterium]